MPLQNTNVFAKWLSDAKRMKGCFLSPLSDQTASVPITSVTVTVILIARSPPFHANPNSQTYPFPVFPNQFPSFTRPKPKRAPTRSPALPFSIDSSAIRHWWLEHVTKLTSHLDLSLKMSKWPHILAVSGRRFEFTQSINYIFILPCRNWSFSFGSRKRKDRTISTLASTWVAKGRDRRETSEGAGFWGRIVD